MSLLLALTGAVAPPPPSPPAVSEASGGWPLWDLVPRRKRRKELDEVMAKPAPAAVVEVLAKPRGVKDSLIAAPKLTATQQAQLDGMFAAIVRAKNEQERARRLAEIAKADGEAQQAQMLLAQAVEAERVAKQQMMDFDLAFVVAVLIEA